MSQAERDLNFVVEPIEEYLCPICAKVLVEPHVTDCCGQHFCEKCLKQWFEQQLGKMICPHCRSEEFSHIRYLPLKRKINELLVYCSNRGNGCTEIICVCQLESHVNQCSYAIIRCSNNCGDSLLRKDLSDHLNNRCLLRLSVCIYCQKQDRHFIIVSLQHHQRCPDFPIGCPKSCTGGELVKRRDLHAHSLICPLESVLCPECRAEMLREKLAEHGKNSCPKRIILCIYCMKQIQYDVTDMHLQGCPEYPIECPRRCESGLIILRKNLTIHRKMCPFEPLVCSACETVVIRKDMSEHSMSTCPKRSTECKYCHRIGPFDDIIGQHVDDCEEFPVGCPKKCHGSEQLKRKNMKSHAEVCPLEPVQCPYSEVGCNPHPHLVRKDLNAHMKLNLENHMLKLMTAHTQLTAEHDKLKNDHTKLKNDFSKLNRDCIKVKTELAETRAKHSEVAENFTKMASSISLEMDSIHKGKINNVSLQCIKTALNPKMKDSKAKLAFRVPPITRRWTSVPFYVLDGYKMSMVFYKEQQKSTTVRSRWAGSATFTTRSSSTSTNVCLQLLEGENDAQLRWPTDSDLTLEIKVTSKPASSHSSTASATKRQGRSAYRQDSDYPSWMSSYQSHQASATYSGYNMGWDREEVYQSDDDQSDYSYGDYYGDTDRDAKSQKGSNLHLSLKLNQHLQQSIAGEDPWILTQSSIDSRGPWTVTLSLSRPKKVPSPDRWSQREDEQDTCYDDYYDPYYD